MQPCLFWSSRLGIARWKTAISAFFFLSHPPFLLWKFVLTHSSHFLFCKDVTLPCTRGLFATAKLKRHCSIKPVNGAVSSRPRTSIKVFPSHSALAVSWQHFAQKKPHTTKQQQKQTKKSLFICLFSSACVRIQCLDWPWRWNSHFCHPQLLTRLWNNNSLKVFTVAVSSIIWRGTRQVASNSLQGENVR